MPGGGREHAIPIKPRRAPSAGEEGAILTVLALVCYIFCPAGVGVGGWGAEGWGGGIWPSHMSGQPGNVTLPRRGGAEV